MEAMNKNYRFKVNLGGMLELLSDHLYSSPDVYIRELLQNGVDAIKGREKKHGGTQAGETWKARITLDIEEGERLIFTDNGQGLTEEEIHRFLAIIGESSKRGSFEGGEDADYIGRFGIGLLSCFMVSDEITLRTRSAGSVEAPLLEWCGKPDGTYSIREITQPQESEEAAGTTVILSAKPGMESYFTEETIERLVIYYGMLLPFPVVIRQGGEKKMINPIYLPWVGRETNKQELMMFGQLIFDQPFFDCLPFSSEAGRVSGVAYILNYSVLPTTKSYHRIYLKNMLLTETGEGLIPDWAVFTRCIVNTTGLRPTASREGFYVDDMLEAARESIEAGLIDYIEKMAMDEPDRFSRFFQLHHLALMSLALESPKLFKTLIDYFEFHTTRGIMTGYDLRTSGDSLIYAPSSAKYKLLSQLFFAQDKLLIDVSYVHALDLLVRLEETFGIEVHAVENWAVEELMSNLSPDDQDAGFEFLQRADKILRKYDCRAELKHLSSYYMPAFYMINENVLLRRQIEAAKEQGNALFFNMLNSMEADLPSDTAAVLYFNFGSPVVKKLVQIPEEELRLFVEILYVQAMQIGGFSLHNNELGMLNRNILELMERGLSYV